MKSVRRRRLAMTVSPRDVDQDAQLMVTSCEDCACAVSSAVDAPGNAGGGRPYTPPGEQEVLVAAREAVRFPVDDEHFVLFHPSVAQGLLVVNIEAAEIFEIFSHARSIAEARSHWRGTKRELESVVAGLVRAGLVIRQGDKQEVQFAESAVLTAWLHVTNACNLRCPYCYIGKTRDKMDAETGRAAVEAVFRSARKGAFKVVKLKYAGGEATLNYGLIEDLQRLARRLSSETGIALEATLLSNGVRITPRFMNFLKVEGIRVMISLDGVGDTHDVQRPLRNGRGSFCLVDKCIDNLLDHGIHPHISVTITNRNLDGAAGAVRYALDRDLTFSLNLFRDNDCASTFNDLVYEEEAMIGCLEQVFDVIEERLPRWSVLGSVLDRGQLVTPRQRSCGVGNDYVVIDQEGRVAKCHMEIEKTLGDVFRDDPLELVRRDLKILNLPAQEKEGCRSCTWQNWCSGGCSVATFRATGRFDVRSPNCGIYKRIYPRALRLEGLRLLKFVS
jgi:uncharacterized protein